MTDTPDLTAASDQASAPQLTSTSASSRPSPLAPQHVVCALYKFVTLEDFEALRDPLLAVMNEHAIRGTLLLAR